MKIDELIDKAKELQKLLPIAQSLPEFSKIFEQYPPEKCREEIDCYKELYKLGTEQKCPPLELYYLLRQGFIAASFQKNILSNDEFKDKEIRKEFMNYCVMFSKAAERYGKILGDEFVKPELWKKSSQDYKI